MRSRKKAVESGLCVAESWGGQHAVGTSWSGEFGNIYRMVVLWSCNDTLARPWWERKGDVQLWCNRGWERSTWSYQEQMSWCVGNIKKCRAVRLMLKLFCHRSNALRYVQLCFSSCFLGEGCSVLRHCRIASGGLEVWGEHPRLSVGEKRKRKVGITAGRRR